MMFSIRKFIKQNLSKKVLHFRNVFSSGQVKRLLNKKLSFASKQSRNRMLLVRGFTLIELLVAMLIATLIISTLLTFVISIVDIDRREQAKVESQGEVQAALDYIADDMQEAVYVYNADGMTGNEFTTPPMKYRREVQG
jgi:prepilin-type N-terminal cleavage/methylation domain-containing protein